MTRTPGTWCTDCTTHAICAGIGCAKERVREYPCHCLVKYPPTSGALAVDERLCVDCGGVLPYPVKPNP